ncbi:uncharacterized protein N7511_000912 [Penicillium nucicola]|uniref:uncharacterized protein n=1 Tax=Penicillium nucicola TaxID=1850975 RepID=UPI002545513B|nr:uncharacterized protein N7511_000912 [Penicillium nucicola]KAJ5775901.1 hypothetical protein N7511_000912 [Penicillium nucicola]
MALNPTEHSVIQSNPLAGTGGPVLCPDWIYSTISDCHVARDREWFSDDYTPFPTEFKSGFGEKVQVLGIGTVLLPTYAVPPLMGPPSLGIIRLENVLHAPTVRCNIIGSPIIERYNLECHVSSPTASGIISERHGQLVAYFKPVAHVFCHLELQLSDPPFGPVLGPSSLNSSTEYSIHAFWSMSERLRYEISCFLTPDEEAWVEKYYKTQADFLESLGLSNLNPEDRTQGRLILRALMSQDDHEIGELKP